MRSKEKYVNESKVAIGSGKAIVPIGAMVHVRATGPFMIAVDGVFLGPFTHSIREWKGRISDKFDEFRVICDDDVQWTFNVLPAPSLQEVPDQTRLEIPVEEVEATRSIEKQVAELVAQELYKLKRGQGEDVEPPDALFDFSDVAEDDEEPLTPYEYAEMREEILAADLEEEHRTLHDEPDTDQDSDDAVSPPEGAQEARTDEAPTRVQGSTPNPPLAASEAVS